MSKQKWIWMIDLFKETIIVGCGGGGCNTVFNLHNNSEIPVLTINTEEHENVSLQMSKNKVGGCRGDSDLGWAVAISHKNEINNRIQGFDNVIVTAGLGGGVGAGTIPVIAECVRENKGRLISIISIPMSFEKDRRRKAFKQLKEIVNLSDLVIIFDIDKAVKIGAKDMQLNDAIFATDELMRESITKIYEMLDGPFQSIFIEKIYTVAYAFSEDISLDSVKALKSSFYDSDISHGKIIVSCDSELYDSEKNKIREAICNKTGIVPEIISGDKNDNGVLLFIPISSHVLLS